MSSVIEFDNEHSSGFFWQGSEELYTMWRGTAVQSLVHDLPDSPYTEEVGTGARAVHIMWRGTAVQSLVHDLPHSPNTEEVGTRARAVHNVERYCCTVPSTRPA